MKKVFLLISVLTSCCVIYGQQQKIVTVEAGGLSKTIEPINDCKLTKIKVNGTIDARDFKFLRESMSYTIEVDLSETNILEYSGDQGTSTFEKLTEEGKVESIAIMDSSEKVLSSYKKNEIPVLAFQDKITLLRISLPLSIKAIRYEAFKNCIGLQSIIIPRDGDSDGGN